METHSILKTAFTTLPDKQALAWSIVDTKSESAIVRAIATNINRTHGRRALVEYPPRVDLVILKEQYVSAPLFAYEAKAAYLTDFQPNRLAREQPDWYLGPCVDDDLTKLQGLPTRYPGVQTAALFFLYELSDPTRQLKYGTPRRVDFDDADAALRERVTLGTPDGPPTTIDCGAVDRTDVKIHMYVFEPRQSP
jgi:hypothetical protein